MASDGAPFKGGPIESGRVDEVCGTLGKAIVGAVKSSHALPVPDEFSYYRSFPEFVRKLDGAKGTKGVGPRALKLLGRLAAHQTPNGDPGLLASGDADADAEDLFDEVVDFADARLEAVDVLLDDLQGKAPAVRQQRIHQGSRGGVGGKGRVRGVPEDLGIAKPQLKFSDPIDNAAATPFVPKAWPKAHGVPPVAPGTVSNGHPYEAEIAALQYAPHQLQGPEGKLPPPGKMEEAKPFTWVSTPSKLMEMIAALQGSTEIAIDLEHHSLRSFQGFTCLIQLSTRQSDFIIDAIELRAHLHALLDVFSDPSITKVRRFYLRPFYHLYPIYIYIYIYIYTYIYIIYPHICYVYILYT